MGESNFSRNFVLFFLLGVAGEVWKKHCRSALASFSLGAANCPAGVMILAGTALSWSVEDDIIPGASSPLKHLYRYSQLLFWFAWATALAEVRSPRSDAGLHLCHNTLHVAPAPPLAGSWFTPTPPSLPSKPRSSS